MESGEIIYEKVYVSPRPFIDNWMKELDSEVAGNSKDPQRIQPKPEAHLSRTVRPVGEQQFTEEIENGILFDHSTRTGKPEGGLESTQSCVSMPTKIKEEDQTRTGRPVMVEELDIHFRVPGLSHAVVKEAEHLRVQEIVKKIENHPHREALHADLQQNNVYNLFSKNSKAMNLEVANVELFELCETIPKVQCFHCLLYWNQRIVYCTCGQFLIYSESRRKFNKLRLGALSTVERYTSHVTFSLAQCALNDVHSHHDSRMCLCASHHSHGNPCRAFECLFSLCYSTCSFPCVSPIPCSSLATSTCTLS